MPATVTVTGKAGAGLSVTAVVFSNVDWFHIDTNKGTIEMYKDGAIISPIDINPATTVTATKSGTTWTLTIS